MHSQIRISCEPSSRILQSWNIRFKEKAYAGSGAGWDWAHLRLRMREGSGVEQTLLSGWATDPLHPNAQMYAKMALNILEKVAPPLSARGIRPKANGREKEVTPRVSLAPPQAPAATSHLKAVCTRSSSSSRGRDYCNSSGSTAGGRRSRGFYAPLLRVHKIENFFGSDFEFCVFIVSYAQILRFCKKHFLISPLLGEIPLFRVVWDEAESS
jgi:hypothetical protein